QKICVRYYQSRAISPKDKFRVNTKKAQINGLLQ
ncbi:MAG: hypothetical protein ACJAV1_003693, partial [Paraglaciecola sp.]